MNGEANSTGRSSELTRLAAALAGLEAAGLLAGAIYFGIETLSSTPDSMGAAISLIVVAVVLAAGLGACVAGILQHRSWVRGPVITWQLVQGGVAMRLTVLVAWWVGLPLLALAIVLGVLIAGPWVAEPRQRAPG